MHITLILHFSKFFGTLELHVRIEGFIPTLIYILKFEVYPFLGMVDKHKLVTHTPDWKCFFSQMPSCLSLTCCSCPSPSFSGHWWGRKQPGMRRVATVERKSCQWRRQKADEAVLAEGIGYCSHDLLLPHLPRFFPSPPSSCQAQFFRLGSYGLLKCNFHFSQFFRVLGCYVCEM